MDSLPKPGAIVTDTESDDDDTLLVLEEKTENADEVVVGYDYNMDEITVFDENPHYPQTDTVLVCAYEEQVSNTIPNYSQADSIESLHEELAESSAKLYSFPASRLACQYYLAV